MATEKRTLRGFANLSIFPVLQNDTLGYKVGTKIAIPGAQSLTSQKEVDQWKIYADDGIFDTGADWKGNTFTLQITDLPHSLRSYFEGGEYDEETGEYTFSSESEAPEIAMSFSSIANSSTKELTKVFSAKCTRVSFEHKTKGESNSYTPVKIEGEFMERKYDKAVFTKKDVTDGSLTWLNTITALGTGVSNS